MAQQVGASSTRCYSYDILVLDASYKQTLATVQSLGRAGLRVALGECFVDCDPSLPVLAFRSRHSVRNVVFPNFATDPSSFAKAVIDFVREHPTRVVLPNSDGTIAALMPYREQFTDLGCVFALAPNSALEIANDKGRTLEFASKLGIDQPKTMRIDSMDDVPAVLTEFGFPLVLKPVASWADRLGHRVVPVEVINEREAVEVAQRFLDGGSLLAQEWACGRRETVTLLMVDGEVMASCVHAVYRTGPALGGVSVLRESIPILEDIYAASVRLARAIGIQGPCEVEFRRDANHRPLLMEINARLAGSIYTPVHSGVNFPLMTWQWAAGLPIDHAEGYRTGVRTRWLLGDFRWLWDNQRRVGRPDSVSRIDALWTFATEFIRTRHYDNLDRRDLGPAIVELRMIAAAITKSRNTRVPS
jgi:predicted ATP-grasp superfamily ATP-dependent carboligase